jgi:hypothetical protein
MTHDASRAHDFDFWIGEWDVFGPKGKQVGTNSITPLISGESGGMLHEHWHGQGGVEGRSINGYDADRGCWHQTWMDSTGGVLQLDGGVRGEAMVLEAPGQRITWTRVTDDPEGAEVRQVWESSEDDGATWTVAFDGRYRRRHAV